MVTGKDTGIGIATEHLPHVFDMLSQVDSAFVRSQGGLGIGLSLVRGLVEMHAGCIKATSDGRGKGSAFVARLLKHPPNSRSQLQHRAARKAPTARRMLVCPNGRLASRSRIGDR